jgi:hypothetical protein
MMDSAVNPAAFGLETCHVDATRFNVLVRWLRAGATRRDFTLVVSAIPFAGQPTPLIALNYAEARKKPKKKRCKGQRKCGKTCILKSACCTDADCAAGELCLANRSCAITCPNGQDDCPFGCLCQSGDGLDLCNGPTEDVCAGQACAGNADCPRSQRCQAVL